MSKIREQITSTIENLQLLSVVSSQLESTTTELDMARNDLDIIEQKMDKELGDLEKLEGFSTRSLFHKVLGNKEQQIEKERQEYLELNSKHENLSKNISILEYERDILQKKLATKAELEVRLVSLKKQRESEIMESDPKLRDELHDIANRLVDNLRRKKELDEAIASAVKSSSLCNDLIQELNGVMYRKQWGQPWHGRRTFRSIRREAMERVKRRTSELAKELQTLKKELAEIDIRIDVRWDEKTIANFSNFFFNNVITDWILRQQLTQSVGALSQTGRDVNEHLSQLKGLLESNQREHQNLYSRREEVIMG